MEQPLFELIQKIVKKCIETENKIRDEFNLTLDEYNGILVIEPDHKIPSQTFSKKMELSPSRGSRVIDRLLKKGYISVETVINDRRSLAISMTAKGHNVKIKIKQRMDECEKRIFSSVTPQQESELRKALTLLADIL